MFHRGPFPCDAGSLAEKMRSYQSGISPCHSITGDTATSGERVTASITSYDQTTSCHEPCDTPSTSFIWPQPAGHSSNEILFWCKINFRDRINWLKIFIEHRMRQSITSINSLQNSNWNLYSFHLPMDSPPTAVSNKFDCDWESNNFKLNKIFVLVY